MLRRSLISTALVLSWNVIVLAQSPAPAQVIVPIASLPSAPAAPPTYPAGVVDVTPEITAQAPVPMTVPACDEVAPFVVTFEYLLLRPYRRDLDYAIVDVRNDLVPQGSVVGLDWQTNSGFRLGFQWRPRGGMTDVAFTYTYAYSNDGGSVAAPTGGVLYPQLTRPGTVDIARTAEGFSSLNYHVFDVDFGRRFALDEKAEARVFLGSRLASISQSLQATYDGFDAHQAQGRQHVCMDGSGLSLGGEARWNIGGRWSAYAKGRGSILVSDYCVRATETNFGGNMLNTDVEDHFMKVVPVLDLGAGLTWSRRNVHFSVGYEISHWFNQVEGITFLDDFAEGKRVRKQSDLSLEAVTFTLGFDF